MLTEEMHELPRAQETIDFLRCGRVNVDEFVEWLVETLVQRAGVSPSAEVIEDIRRYRKRLITIFQKMEQADEILRRWRPVWDAAEELSSGDGGPEYVARMIAESYSQ